MSDQMSEFAKGSEESRRHLQEASDAVQIAAQQVIEFGESTSAYEEKAEQYLAPLQEAYEKLGATQQQVQEAVEGKVSTAMTSVEGLFERMDDLQEKSTSANEAVQSRMEALDEAFEADRERLQSGLQDAEAAVESITADTSERMATLSGAFEGCQQTMDAYAGSVEEAGKKIETQIDGLSKEIESAREDAREAIQEGVDAFEQRLGNLSEKMKAVTSETLQPVIDDARDELRSRIDDQIKPLIEESLGSLRELLDGMFGDMEARADENDNLRHETKRLVQEIESLSGPLGDMVDKVQDIAGSLGVSI